jgi:hypothetical protein
MSEPTNAVWWIELIKVSPGLVTASLAVGVVIVYRKEVRSMLTRMTKFKGLGMEAEFDSRALESAIAAQKVTVNTQEKKGALNRLHAVGTLLQNSRILWVDDVPASTRNERALLESAGARVTSVTTSAAAEKELRDNVYTMVISRPGRVRQLCSQSRTAPTI